MTRTATRTCITCKEEKDLHDGFPYVCGGLMSKGTKCKGCSTVHKKRMASTSVWARSGM